MCWNADVQGKLPGIELNIHSGWAWLCGLRLKRFRERGGAAPGTNNVSGVRMSQSWAYPAHPRASGFREGTGSTLASRQTPAWTRWLHQPSQDLCPQCWKWVCCKWVWGNVPKAVLAATLMEISVPDLLSLVKDLGRRFLELCRLRAHPACWEQCWETACVGIFQVIALSTQNHLCRRYLLILQREVPGCCSLGAWSVLFILILCGYFLFFLSFFLLSFIWCVICSCSKSSALLLRFLVESWPLFFYEKEAKNQTNWKPTEQFPNFREFLSS